MIEYGSQIGLYGDKILSPEEISDLFSKGAKYLSNTIGIIKILAEQANFTSYIQILHFKYDLEKGSIFTPIYINGTAFYYHEVFYIATYENYHGALHISLHVFEQQEMSFVVTPGIQFTPYEKLLLPFDALTWIFLMTTIASAFLVIFIVNFMPKIIQNILYGQTNSSPILNVLGIFFGIAQTKIPFSNFGRIILAAFILFCMVLRHGYQGVFFEMLTTDMRQQPVKNIDEVLQQNFTVVLENTPTEYQFIKNFVTNDTRLRVYRIHSLTLLQYFCRNIKTSEAKLAFLMDSKTLIKYSNYCRKNGIVFADTIARFPYGFATYPNSDIYEVLDKTLPLLASNGIAAYLFNHLLALRFKDEQEPPKVLSCDDLSFGFIVWWVACAISVIGFIFELLYEFILRQLRIVTLNFVGIYLIKTWIENEQFI